MDEAQKVSIHAVSTAGREARARRSGGLGKTAWG